ncbi:MAG: trigger factor [Desulfobacterales bacterium]|uniref:Trigger factor n=1 Tax=Candidatus Desulfaltia bathyphila TaxID=2841697 RepID=A0A8J6N5D2_9BACT|nr:trigger factor [Candidatus Desulfaltia bathyphila]MBL7195445.1 trigger factor [Desulfobacterales bacterium]MBL7207576.1 trigger factor [Desulfobacterales bacterium]
MQVTVEDINTVKKKLYIEIPNDVVVQELDQAYKNLKKTAKIKGYRPGKTPRSVLERLFKKDVHYDVSSKLLQDSLINAIKEKDLKVIGTPKIDPPGLDAKEPYKYDATIEVQPEIDDLDFKGLKLKKNLYKVSNEEISAQLKMLQKNLAQQKTVEEARPVQKEDFALIDYEGFKDGKPFAETQKTENFTLKVGNGKIFKEFDEQLIGMNPGESKEINIHFSEDYFNKKLANLDITFHVKLNEIREEVLPEINDEFAKDLGKYETLDELKNAISDNLQEGYKKRTEQELNEQIFTALIAKKDFEVPDIMVEYELNSIIADIERSFAYSNTSMEDLGLSKENLSEKYRDTAIKQVKRHLILNKLIEQEKLTLSDEEINNGFKEMSKVFNKPLEEISSFYKQNKDNLELFKNTLLEKKSIKLIIENSIIENVEPKAEQMTLVE